MTSRLIGKTESAGVGLAVCLLMLMESSRDDHEGVAHYRPPLAACRSTSQGIKPDVRDGCDAAAGPRRCTLDGCPLPNEVDPWLALWYICCHRRLNPSDGHETRGVLRVPRDTLLSNLVFATMSRLSVSSRDNTPRTQQQGRPNVGQQQDQYVLAAELRRAKAAAENAQEAFAKNTNE